ncbi:hypothetical protein ACFL2S_10210 [Thermodesulfobacteriota bacterium]
MEDLQTISGWAIHIFNLLFMLSGGYYIVRTARKGGVITYMGLCQWGFSIVCAWIFSVTVWNKLHLLWIIPAGLFISFTPIGRFIGSLIGRVTNALLAPPHLENTNKNKITDDDFE